MKSSNLVTSCIPLYNGELYLSESIQSVLNQEQSLNRLLISDDGSIDSSLDIARDFIKHSTEIKLTINANPSGMAANWNACAQQVDTPYFTLLHQDDTQAKTFLSKAVHFLEKHPNVGIVFTDLTTMDANGQIFQDKKAAIKKRLLGKAVEQKDYVFKSEELAKILLRGNVFCCPAAVYRKAAFEKLGPFSTEYHFVQDWEYWIRACINQVSIGYINEPLFQYRTHGQNATAGLKKDFRKYRERQTILNVAFKAFEDKNWVKHEDYTIVKSSIFNVMLWDLAEELAIGTKASFQKHMTYAMENISGFSSYPPAKALRRFSFLGARFGKLALAFGKALSGMIMR